MILNHKSNAEQGGASAHRPGGIHFHYLLTGKDGAKDNFVLALVETEDRYSTPRHRHNFEQVRFNLEGDFEYSPGMIQKEGTVGYFSEGVPYTQHGVGHSEMLLLQIGGASGAGYMSHRQLRAAVAELEKTGSFDNGVYCWRDDSGQTHNQDGYEAAWEHVFKRKISYPNPRYDAPVIMNPDAFAFLPLDGVPGVTIRDFGRFNERGLEIRQARMDKDAVWDIDGTARSYLVYVRAGEGEANGELWGPESAFQVEKGETVTVTAREDSELYMVGLPVFED